jgi:glycosyltransferase involved in cell wall biosynthesis
MVIERYLPIWGGAENQLRELARELSKADVSVEILTRRWSPSHPPVEKIDGVTVHRIGVPGESALARMVFIFSLAWSIVRMRSQFDVLHAHGAVKLGALTALTGKATGRPTVAKIATAGHIPDLRRSILGRGLLNIFKRADAVICMTVEIRRELESIDFAPARIARIGNGVDTRRFSPAPPETRTDWRRKQGLAHDAVVAVYSGRIVRRKGVDVLVDAWRAVDAPGCDAHLFLIGSGDQQPDSVEADIRDAVDRGNIANVVFAGQVADPETYLNAADLFLFPSRREGYPNALLEAMSSGTAVVASNIGGCSDLVIPGETGLLVAPDDPEALAAAIRSLLSSPKLRTRLQRAARRSVKHSNAIEVIAASYRSLYERLAVR